VDDGDVGRGGGLVLNFNFFLGFWGVEYVVGSSHQIAERVSPASEAASPPSAIAVWVNVTVPIHDIRVGVEAPVVVQAAVRTAHVRAAQVVST